jgi:hypothetical protein
MHRTRNNLTNRLRVIKRNRIENGKGWGINGYHENIVKWRMMR